MKKAYLAMVWRASEINFVGNQPPISPSRVRDRQTERKKWPPTERMSHTSGESCFRRNSVLTLARTNCSIRSTPFTAQCGMWTALGAHGAAVNIEVLASG